jgi:hypothetical protein
LHENFVVPEHEAMHAALKLEPEEHDTQVDTIIQMVAQKGIRNALSVAARMKNPHLEDDVHRALVRYVVEGLSVKGIKPSAEVWKALHLTLFEIQPQGTREKQEGNQPRKTLEQVLASTEQLYAGLLNMTQGGGMFSMEIAVAQGTEEAVFYIAVPHDKRTLFERQVFAVFPNARVSECRGDYNLFTYGGEHVGAVAHLADHHAFPLKTYQAFEHDPMNVLLSSFSKLAKHGEGAAIQIVVGNEGERYNKHYKKILKKLNKGVSPKKAVKVPETKLGELAKDVMMSFITSDKNKEQGTVDQNAVEAIGKKMMSRVVPVAIRAVASAKDQGRAREILSYITSSFSQFDDPKSNRIKFHEVGSWHINAFLRAYTYRVLGADIMPLSLAELTTLFHLTAERVSTSRELKQSRSKQSPAPVTMSDKGITLGINKYGASESKVLIGPNDRLRHMYVIGQTGTGKSVHLQNMIVQDIKNGDGVCFIDPHGNDIQDILAAIPPERKDDVIYFDPAYTPRAMGLNILEYDTRFPEMKSRVVDDLYGIFKTLYADTPDAFGPMFEQYYRNATLLTVDDPATGSTLIEISRVFTDKAFRDLKLSRCKNPLIKQFWEKTAGEAGGEASLENIVPYIVSKIDVFLTNEIMRPIVAQEKSAFNFREIMDNKKILLVNLSKGRLGEKNANMLGLIIVSKFLQAALSRVDSAGKDLPVFYLYIDEFQNFTVPSIATILSEARKYKLSLGLAHQFIKQLDEKIKDAVFGNVGNKCIFRVGTEDAEFLAKSLEPEFGPTDIEHLDNYNAYVSMLVNGYPAKPFSIVTMPPPKKVLNPDEVDALKESSYTRFGRDREEVEAEIRDKFDPPKPNRVESPFSPFSITAEN